MDEFEIIDAHAHLVRTIEEESNYYVIPGRRARNRYGTPEKALEYMDWEGISRMAFMILIPHQYRKPLFEKAKLSELPEKQRKEEKTRISNQIGPLIREFNAWGCEVGCRFPRLLPFICISDDLGGPKAMVDEVVLRAEQGAKGIKLHPAVFSFFPDNSDFWPLYEKAQQLGLPVLSDTGPYLTSLVLTAYPSPVETTAFKVNVDYGQPKNFERVLQAFPRLTLILAHLGSGFWDERVELALKYPNVCFDTARGFSAPDFVPFHPHRGLAEEDAVRIIRKIGVDRIMFGTDFPSIPPQPQIEQILRLPLTDEEKRKLLSENAKRIMRI